MKDLSLTSRAGLWLAVAAVAVNAPRLILAFLEADGVSIAPTWRVSLLGLTGIATGVVLTGGGAYLAHAVARGSRFHHALALAWGVVLTCTALLVTPVLVAGLARTQLVAVLPTWRLRWAWSAVAVLAVELVAAGAMVAHAARRRELEEQELSEQELFELATERNRLASELAQLKARHQELEARQSELSGAAAGASGGARSSPEQRASTSSGSRARELSRQTSDMPAPPTVAPGEPVPCRFDCGAVFATLAAERGHLHGCPRRKKLRSQR